MNKTQKKLLYIGAPIILLIIVIVFFSTRKAPLEYSTVAASYGPLVQTVSETGTVKPIKELSLNFLSLGKIDSVLVNVGDEVVSGDVLASLDTSSLELRRQETVAALNIAQANLAKIRIGASYEAVNIAKRSLEQAQASEASARLDLEKTNRTLAENIRQAEKNYNDLIAVNPETLPAARQSVLSAELALINSEKTQKKTIDNARGSLILVLSDKILTVRVALDNVKKIFDDEDTKNILSVLNSVYKAQTDNSRQRVVDSISDFESLLAKARASLERSDILAAADSLSNILYQTSLTLDSSYLMLENTITSSTFSQAQLDAYKSLIISQSAQISGAASALESATQGYNNAILGYSTGLASAQSSLDQAKTNLDNAILAAKNNVSNIKLASEQQQLAAASRLDNAIKSVNLAKAQYNSTIAPASNQDLQLAQAQVAQAQAALDNIDKQISDMSLVAPMDGVISALNYKAGEQFSASNLAMIKMLVDNSFEIEVDISESSISKVKEGDLAEITLDAFSDDLVLEARVSFIEPAQTLISGVVYYKVSLEFNNPGELQEILKANSLTLKSGMTANVVITTDSLDNVLSVPARAVIEKEGQKYLRVLEAKDYREVPVETGLRGDSGSIEVRGDINSGDLIITFIREASK